MPLAATCQRPTAHRNRSRLELTGGLDLLCVAPSSGQFGDAAMTDLAFDRRMANAIRALAMDARREGQVRPSRHADGHGRRRDGAVHPLPEVRPGRPELAGPRPLRALGRPRLDAALFAPLPHRLRGDDDRRDRSASASSTRRRPATRRISSRPASRRPPARSARASARRSAWRSPSACSPPSSATTSSTTAPSCSAPTAT